MSVFDLDYCRAGCGTPVGHQEDYCGNYPNCVIKAGSNSTRAASVLTDGQAECYCGNEDGKRPHESGCPQVSHLQPQAPFEEALRAILNVCQQIDEADRRNDKTIQLNVGVIRAFCARAEGAYRRANMEIPKFQRSRE